MKRLLLVPIILILAACQTVEPYDYTKLRASKPRSILVLPPLNDSVEVNAEYTFLSTISKPLAEKGYYVFPVAVIDLFLKENGLPSSAEMQSVPLAKLQQETGADAVLYVNINKWGQSYQIISSVTTVSSDARLVDARTGEELWAANIHYQQSSDDGGGGIIGALVGAIATQIVGSVSDKTPAASSYANNMAINNSARGLLPGPYKAPL